MVPLIEFIFEDNYATVVSCAKICRNVGILSNSDAGDESGKTFIYENIDATILENTVVSDDEQVKLIIFKKVYNQYVLFNFD
jgi:hypothetical protein